MSLSADLTVDATGRTSRTPKWLENQGYQPPEVADVNVDLVYSTTTVERDSGDKRAFWAPASPPYTRGGGVLPVEGDRWQMVMHGVHGDDPPRDVDAFRDFASTLQINELEQILDSHDILSEDIDYYPFPSNRVGFMNSSTDSRTDWSSSVMRLQVTTQFTVRECQ